MPLSTAPETTLVAAQSEISSCRLRIRWKTKVAVSTPGLESHISPLSTVHKPALAAYMQMMNRAERAPGSRPHAHEQCFESAEPRMTGALQTSSPERLTNKESPL